MSFKMCCNVDEINAGGVQAGESQEKGPALEIARVEEKLPSPLEEMWHKDKVKELRTHAPNWSFQVTSAVQKFAGLRDRWKAEAEKDTSLKQYDGITIHAFVLAHNGYYLGQAIEQDSKNKQYTRQGLGHYFDGYGTYYLGYWERDLFQKLGLLVRSNGDYLYGEFYNGKIIYGEQYKRNEGKLYKGAFDGEEEPYGAGVILYDNERKYKGIVKHGKPHGVGTFTWPNGNYYEGQFLDGKQHGNGDLFVVKSETTLLDESNIEVGKTDKPGKLYRNTTWENGVLKS